MNCFSTSRLLKNKLVLASMEQNSTQLFSVRNFRHKNLFSQVFVAQLLFELNHKPGIYPSPTPNFDFLKIHRSGDKGEPDLLVNTGKNHTKGPSSFSTVLSCLHGYKAEYIC